MNHLISSLIATRKKVFVIFLAISLLLTTVAPALAWLAPASNPPAGNVSARVDTSAYQQTKVGSLYVSGTLGIGTASPDASALLDISSVSQGVLFPRLTTSQLNAVSSPTAGLMAFNASTQQLNSYTTSWNAVGGSGGGVWTATGTQLYYTGGNVGIGDTSPGKALSVNGTISAPASSTVRIKASGPVAGNNNNGSIYFLDSTGTSRGRFDTTTLAASQLNVGWWKLDEASGITAADSSGNNFTATGADYPKPSGWWAMDEASGSTIADSSGGANTMTASVNTSNLLGWWKLDETSGTSLGDSSGNALTGTSVNATITTTGQKYGAAARVLNGTSAYLSLPASVNTLGSYTYEVWVNMVTTAGTQMIFDKEIGGSLWPSVRMYVVSGVVYCDFYKSSSVQQVVNSGSPVVTAGVYTHLACTYDGSNLRVYANGSLVNTAAASGTPNNINNQLVVGAIQYSTAPNYQYLFNGTIDDIRIYTTALSQLQIQTDMNNNVYSYPSVVAGKYGNARSLNGFNYVQASNLNFTTQPFTIEFWVNPTSLANSPVIISDGDYNVGGFYMHIVSGGSLNLYTNQSGASQLTQTAGGLVPLSSWTHIALARNGTTMQIYINGTLAVTNNAIVSPAATTRPFTMGTYSGDLGCTSWCYNGLIDDVRVYNNITLSQAQIQTDMNNNTFTGPTVVAGKYNNARQFNGATQYMSVANASALNPASITIEAWIKPTVLQAGNFVDKGDNSGYRFRTLSSGLVQFLDRGGTNTLSSVTSISTGVWTHVAVTGDSSGLKIYINGNLDASNAVAYGGASTSNPLVFGAYATSAEYYSGGLDDVRVYNYALSQALIQADMAGGAPPGNTAYGTMYIGVANTTSQDLAEWYPASDPTLAPGMLVALDSSGKLTKASQSDSSLLGVISTNPGVTLGTNDTGDNNNQQKVALSGKVPTMVNTTNGPIQPGDLITVDPQHPGQGTKLTGSGWYVGKALQSLDQGTGMVEVFANAGYWNDPNQNSSIQASVQSVFGSVLKKAGAFMDTSGLHFDSLIGDVAHTGILKAPHLELIDSATGDLYCVTIQNGQLNKVKQACQ